MIAGYHWFTDWGRDTMISLEGLTLVHRSHRRGRLDPTNVRAPRPRRPRPEHVPRGANAGPLSHRRCDAVVLPRDRSLPARVERRRRSPQLLPTLRTIIAKHLGGTQFGIGVDPTDGLLREGAPGYQLTWMDAKCDDWVVTPRRGKAVEINALWYNALCVMVGWLQRAGDRGRCAGARGPRRDARRPRSRAGSGIPRPAICSTSSTASTATIRRVGRTSCSRCRCRTRCSIHRAGPRCSTSSRQQLLTPVGLRSLAPTDPEFKPTLRRRPARARRRLSPGHGVELVDRRVRRRADARACPTTSPQTRAKLDGLIAHLGEACIGSVSEVFDAMPPFTPRGCIAQAWGVAELLRALVITS